MATNWADQGKQFASFVEGELQAENERRESVNSRAATALTGATGLITVVLAVFAVLIGKDSYALSGGARWALGLALIALLLAAVCAVIAGIPWKHKLPKPGYLQELLDDHWQVTEVAARNITASCTVEVIAALRAGTNIKFWFLLAAGALQASAAASLVVCTFFVI